MILALAPYFHFPLARLSIFLTILLAISHGKMWNGCEKQPGFIEIFEKEETLDNYITICSVQLLIKSGVLISL